MKTNEKIALIAVGAVLATVVGLVASIAADRTDRTGDPVAASTTADPVQPAPTLPPTTTVTEPPTTATTTTATVATEVPTIPAGLDQELSGAAFDVVVQSSAPEAWDDLGQVGVRAMAAEACAQLAAGDDPFVVVLGLAMFFESRGLDIAEAGTIVGAGVPAFCPEHEETMNEFYIETGEVLGS